MPKITIDGKEVDISEDLFNALINEGGRKELEDFSLDYAKKKKQKTGSNTADDNEPLSQSRDLFFSPAVTTPGRSSMGSISSQQSTLQSIAAQISKSILLRFEIDEDNKIKIITNREQRPNTDIAGSQGDHVTAYITLLQAICSMLDGEDVHEAPKMLFDVTKCFLDNADIMLIGNQGRLISFEEKLAEIKTLFFPREIRKDLTKYLRIIREIKPESIPDNAKFKEAIEFLSKQEGGILLLNINQLRDCIKRSNQSIFAQLVVEVGEKFLEKYNTLSTAAFPKLRIVKDQSGKLLKGSNEGNRVKGAMKYLRLINKLIALKNVLNIASKKEDKIELMDEFIEQCENIIKTSKPNIKYDEAVNTDFQKFLNLSFSSTQEVALKRNPDDLLKYLESKDLVNINAEQIGRWFNDLFDFKQKNIVKAEAGEPDGLVTNVGGEKKIALESPEKTLYEVTARHINFMFIAFKHLCDLSNESKRGIIDKFIERVMSTSLDAKKDNSQGWGEYSIPGLFGEPNINLTTNILADGVKELCDIYKNICISRHSVSVSSGL